MDFIISKELPDLIFGDFIIKVDESKLLLKKTNFFIDESIYNKFPRNTEEPWIERKYKKKYYCSDYESSDSYDSDY